MQARTEGVSPEPIAVFSGSSLSDHHMKLPSLSAFDASGKDDDGTHKRWLAKLEKNAELFYYKLRRKLVQFEIHLFCNAENTHNDIHPE